MNTSFLTNLEPEELRVRTAPELYKAVQEASDAARKEQTKDIPRYSYPPEVITAALVAKYSKHGLDFRVTVAESAQIGELDAQKEVGKAIYGKGYLISPRLAEQREACEAETKTRAAEAALQRAKATREDVDLDDEGRVRWRLSERERAIVQR